MVRRRNSPTKRKKAPLENPFPGKKRQNEDPDKALPCDVHSQRRQQACRNLEALESLYMYPGIAVYLARVESELLKQSESAYSRFIDPMRNWWTGSLGDVELIKEIFIHLRTSMELLEDAAILLETKDGTNITFCYSPSNEVYAAVLWKSFQGQIVALSPKPPDNVCEPATNDELRQMMVFGYDLAANLQPIWAPCILSGQIPFVNRKNEGAVLKDLISGIRPTRPDSHWCSDRIWALIERYWVHHAKS
ncbi:hypothetical protein D9758_003371 [Tetrapyrgos nigripes]|uniref:Uncharacterized protein n=1 Tax=Tetrapyrgos nigripes TaxID=182062 RepID=A0A8H5LW60_9AGAR|nr:hypothetical protein D9758_003371 [Tetrapyrgos nigripes]